MALKTLEIMAPGLSSPLVISSGGLDGQPKILRQGGLVRAELGESSAGYSIGSARPDFYSYQLVALLDREDWNKLEKILEVQLTLPRAIQFVDKTEPILLTRITGVHGRTAFGPPIVSGEGTKSQFQSYCSVFNETPSEEVVDTSGSGCKFIAQVRLREI